MPSSPRHRHRAWASVTLVVVAQLLGLAAIGSIAVPWGAGVAGVAAAVAWWRQKPADSELAALTTIASLAWIATTPDSALVALAVTGTLALVPLSGPQRWARAGLLAAAWGWATATTGGTGALAAALALGMLLEHQLEPPPPASTPPPATPAPLVRARAERDTLLERLATGIAGELDTPITRALALLEQDHPAGASLLQIRQTLADLRQLGVPPPLVQRRQRELGHVFSVAADEERAVAPPGARMRVAPPPEAVVFISELRLRQVLGPLLANAWEAAGPSGTVALSAELREDGVHLHVDDDGRGLPAVDPARLFDPLWTTHPTEHSTGLGLPLARVAARSMGAELRAGTSPLGGARFTAVLPLAPDQPTTRPESSVA